MRKTIKPYSLLSLSILERAGHGVDIAASTDLTKYYGIVIVSGDGLTYEVCSRDGKVRQAKPMLSVLSYLFGLTP